MPSISSVATALPKNHYKQTEILDAVKGLFRPVLQDLSVIEHVFQNSQIEDRYIIKPFEEIFKLGSLAERNRVFCQEGLALAESAVQECLAKANVAPKEIGAIIFVSTTGFAVPTLEVLLMNKLSFAPTTRRFPIFGWGCTGGVVGLAKALEYAKAYPKERVLLVNLELCTLAYQKDDRSQKFLIASALFNDGAAAVLVEGDEVVQKDSRHLKGPSILRAKSYLFPNSLDVMGWEDAENGFRLVLSPKVPERVRQDSKAFADSLLAEEHATLQDLSVVLSHTGGAKVLEALEEALAVPHERLQFSWEVLKKYGNMSSVSVLFVLKQAIQQGYPEGSLAAMLSFGPGFSVEGLLLRW